MQRNVLDSGWVYGARTAGVLGLIVFLWARSAVSERMRKAFDR